MTDKRSTLCLLVAFAMLWLPLGQHDFLLENWMKVGTFMAPFLLFVAFAFRADPRKEPGPDIRLASLALFIAYIVHQFEEHWVDVFGRVYAFKPYLNAVLLDRLSAPEGAVGPLSDAGVFVINTSLVWLVAAIAILRAPGHVFPALCMASIVVVNAVSHTGTAIAAAGYNPGLLTAVVLFLPLGLTLYVWIIRSGIAGVGEVGASLLWGFLAHVVMIAGMIASGWLHLIPEAAYFAVLIVWSTLPVLFYRRAV
ncbi:MAG: HXXEE domain-containing protein [Pseudomonadota bacterium]